MVDGCESLIVQRDVCGLSVAEGEELSVWAARALVSAALEDGRAAPEGNELRVGSAALQGCQWLG